jgi:hypothetical protein
MLFVSLAAAGFCGLAHGDAPEARAAYEKEVMAACVAASNLRRARPGGGLVEFDDRVGVTALVVVGRYPQPHMKNQRGRVLCLFDRKTRTATVSDADAMLRKP